MEHQLISAIETALGWSGPEELGKDFVHGSMDDPALVSRIMTPNRLLDIAMRRSLNRPQFRCFQKGEEVHPAIYYTDSVSPRGQSISMVNMRSLGRLLGEGATVIMDQANVFDPTMEVACRALQWWSHERVQVNAYLTTNDASGFPCTGTTTMSSSSSSRVRRNGRSARPPATSRCTGTPTPTPLRATRSSGPA